MDYMAHPMVATADATTMTNSVQQLVATTNEKSTQIDRAPRPQTVQASTQKKPPSRNYEEELKA